MSIRSVLIGALFAAVMACSSNTDTGESARNPGDSLSATVYNPPREAVAVFDAYLTASRRMGDRATVESLSCEDGGAGQLPTQLLASWVVVSHEPRGDTVVVRAQVTTVAEIDVDRRGVLVGRQRVRSDILEWDIFVDDNANWVVCNGLRFGFSGDTGQVSWRPEGASFESVLSRLDVTD